MYIGFGVLIPVEAFYQAYVYDFTLSISPALGFLQGSFLLSLIMVYSFEFEADVGRDGDARKTFKVQSLRADYKNIRRKEIEVSGSFPGIKSDGWFPPTKR